MTGERFFALCLIGVAMWLLILGIGPVPLRIIVCAVAVLMNVYTGDDE